MDPRPIADDIFAVGAQDGERRLFDGLIPLPDGTSYNAYLIRGSEKAALIDTVDPTKTEILMDFLSHVSALDFVVAHHGEQDHSGSLPVVLGKYPGAKVVCSPKAKGILIDLLAIPEDKFVVVEDGARIGLGGLTLEFVHTPWVHWPETMCTYLPERKILFSCDFFGAHLAQSGLFAKDDEHIQEAAKRYFAEIMMPFRTAIQKNMEHLKGLAIETIAPSHGPIRRRPGIILTAYREWIEDKPKNEAVVAYVSMHGSTAAMVKKLAVSLTSRRVGVTLHNLADGDVGELAMALVDAGTVILAGPAVLAGLHPKVAFAAVLANALRPRARFASFVGSFGWGHKMIDQLLALLPNLKVEVIPPVLCRGLPKSADYEAIDALAATVAAKHKDADLA